MDILNHPNTGTFIKTLPNSASEMTTTTNFGSYSAAGVMSTILPFLQATYGDLDYFVCEEKKMYGANVAPINTKRVISSKDFSILRDSNGAFVGMEINNDNNDDNETKNTEKIYILIYNHFGFKSSNISDPHFLLAELKAIREDIFDEHNSVYPLYIDGIESPVIIKIVNLHGDLIDIDNSKLLSLVMSRT